VSIIVHNIVLKIRVGIIIHEDVILM